MVSTSRKKRPLDRGKVAFRDSWLIVVAIEGAKTEKWYFELFQHKRIQIIVRENIENKSAPRYVMHQLQSFSREYDLDEEDQLWLVIDKDRWRDEELYSVCRECDDQGFYKAVSNPCFEYWLLLYHHELPEIQSSRDAKSILGKIHDDLNPARLDTIYEDPERLRTAVRRARKIDSDPAAPFPSETGTHVYKITEQLL